MNFPAINSHLFGFLTKHIPALRTIDRVADMTGGDPMPTKLLAAYAFFGTNLLALWCMCWSARTDNRDRIIARCTQLQISTRQMILCIPMMSMLAIGALYFANVEFDPIPWGVAAAYSPWLLSAALFLTWSAAIAVFQILFYQY